LYQATTRLVLYGRFALKFGANGRPDTPLAATLTMLTQNRFEYRLARSFDVAGEGRYLWQPSGGSARNSLGAELGYWVLPDLRLAGGCNFTRATEPFRPLDPGFQVRRGFYFVISSKLSNLFNLFGASRQGLMQTEANNSNIPPHEEEEQ